MEGHPYNFLENEGEDIDALKNDDIAAATISYVERNDNGNYNNELFLRTVITKSINSNKYNEMFLIKYPLTDKELSDYFMLNNGNYYQAKFFLQELDNQKQGQLISKFTIEKNTYNGLVNRFNTAKTIPSLFSAENIDNFNVIDFVPDENDPESYFMTVKCMFKTEDDRNERYRHIGKMTIRIHSYGGITFNNNILRMEDPTRFNIKENPSDIKEIIKDLLYGYGKDFISIK